MGGNGHISWPLIGSFRVSSETLAIVFPMNGSTAKRDGARTGLATTRTAFWKRNWSPDSLCRLLHHPCWLTLGGENRRSFPWADRRLVPCLCPWRLVIFTGGSPCRARTGRKREKKKKKKGSGKSDICRTRRSCIMQFVEPSLLPQDDTSHSILSTPVLKTSMGVTADYN